MEPTTTHTLADFLKPSALKNRNLVWRDRDGRVVAADERAIDLSRLSASNGAPVTLIDLGRRVRLFNSDMSKELRSVVLSSDLVRLSKESPQSVAGIETPLGKVISDHGLYLKLRPGLSEVGINDRNDLILRHDESDGDATRGPVINSANTVIAGRAERLVTRTRREDHEADRAEALAWLRAFELADKRKTLVSKFLCAGVSYAQCGNVPYLYRTSRLNFFATRDPAMLKMRADLEERFRKVGRKLPNVEIISLIGVPRNEAEYRAFLRRLPAKHRHTLGLPSTLARSRFFDPKNRAVVSSNFVFFCPLSDLGDRVTVMTVNTDYHGEVKSRGVLSPLMAIMSLIGIISAHAGTAVQNSRGTATTFTGPTGTGKTTACTFWAEKNERYRREELRRRYEIDFARNHSPEAARTMAEELMPKVGILCQEDWVEIVPHDGAHRWVFWPTERTCYARTGGFPGLRFVLAENAPLLENACADFGAAGDPAKLGRVTHDYFPERLFYDPDWNHMLYDRSPRQISANVFLERDRGLDFIIKRVTPQEGVHWLLKGRTPQGKFEPLYNAYPDFSGLLMAYGVVGDRLVEAYEAAKAGDHAALAGGDEVIGRALFDKLNIQVNLWLSHMADVPTFIVNGAPGLEITQDANWFLSEYPDFFDSRPTLGIDEFKELMRERYGVTYGDRGQWTHITR
ncbi:MAG TPA: phosphoenolpyruvate carboxykinase (ATP) [Candidatus Binataceae bacterium]|nr:phosphoenolpyruvate carboxykinase (ATP) [Candidatus Binataceae bacterium]